MNPDEIPTETIADTEHYLVWVSEEPDGELAYHIDLGPVTVHFFREEWDEFLTLMQDVRRG